jgi:hypothetical protein
VEIDEDEEKIWKELEVEANEAGKSNENLRLPFLRVIMN